MLRFTTKSLCSYSLALVCFLMLWPTTETAAQEADSSRTLHGTVVDGVTGEPIAGVRVALLAFSAEGTAYETGHGAVADKEGYFKMQLADTQRHALQITSIGYRSRQIALMGLQTDLRVVLYPELETSLNSVSVQGVRRSRSVEDGCCRVESIRDEVQQHAPFSPSPVESLRRYSSCTSGRVINSIDDAGTISLRGLEPTRVGLLLDGTPLFTGYSRFYGLGVIPSHALQTIQITEGASDTRYGNGAISGVVNMQTRLPTEEPELTGSFTLLGESTDPDQADLNVGFTGMVGEIGVGAFGSYNNHHTLLQDQGGTLDRKYERGSAVLKANMLVDNNTEVTATLLGGKESRNGVVTTEGENDYEHSLDLNRLDGILSVSRLVGESGELIGTGAVSRVETSGMTGTTPIDGTQTILYGEARFTGLSGDHSYALGVQGRNDDLNNEFNPLIAYSISTLSFYAQDALTLSEKWMLQAGGRVDHHSSAGTNVAPRGSIRFAPVDNVTMRLMVGGGLKGEAEFDEEYRVLTGAYRWQPNPDLGFERSWTVNYDMSWDAIFGESFGLNTNFNTYYTLIDGRHTPQLDSLARGIFFPVNDNNAARLMGLEVQARWTFGDSWSGSTALSMIDYTTVGTNGSREHVPLAPQLNVDASLTYRNVSAGWLAETWGSRIGSQRLPAEINGKAESVPYVIVNARAEKEFGPVALFVGVLNMLDEQQVEVMPLVLRTTEIPNGGITWGLAEGREFLLGIRMRIQ